jgi:HK97 gp10 family phage protein
MSFEVDCDDFCNGLDLVKKAYPKRVEKFMLKEGARLKSRIKKNARQRVKQKTGNYIEGIRRGKHYVYRMNGKDSVRVYNAAPHAHLVEDGHTQQTEHGEIFVEGKHVFRDSEKEFEPVFEADADKFVDEVLEGL